MALKASLHKTPACEDNFRVDFRLREKPHADNIAESIFEVR